MTSAPALPGEYSLAIDIEKAGDGFDDAILMIGTCLGDAHGNILEKRAFCGPVPPDAQFQPECWNSFWVKHPDVLSRIRDAQGTPDFLRQFMDYFYGIEDELNIVTDKNFTLTLLSDNPAYDISNIDASLVRAGYKRPLRYTRGGKYLCVSDPSEMLGVLLPHEQACVRGAVERRMPPSQQAHLATDDAQTIYHTYVAVQEVVRARTRRNGTGNETSLVDSSDLIGAALDCPYGEPLHYHHDGCPSCESSSQLE